VLIVIGSSPDRQNWLSDCSASINREHVAVINFGFELGKIGWVMKNTKAERFLFLQDSWVIKDDSFWELLENEESSVCLNADPYYYGCYAGIYERRIIEQIGIPVIESKLDAIENEIAWHKDYVRVAGEPKVLFPELTDKNATRTVEKNGRTNLVLENDYILKYKGTWY
jgi:hypothetical protein